MTPNPHFKSGPKQATLFTLVDQSLNLDKKEQIIFEEIINSHDEYKEVKMLQSIEEVGYKKGLEQGHVNGYKISDLQLANETYLGGSFIQGDLLV